MGEEGSLNEIVRLVGRDSLTEDQKVILETAKIIKDEFLQQNAFSEHDKNCPLWKTAGMMRCICHFYNACIRALAEQDKEKENKVTWELLKNQLNEEIYIINNLKFCIPLDSNKASECQKYDDLCYRIDQKVKK